MSEEEKEAIEWFREDTANEKEKIGLFNDYKKQIIKRNERILRLIQNQQKGIEKKDKIIDLMAKYIYKREDNKINIGRIYCPKSDCDDINRDVDCDFCIKQYFEKKVEEK